MGKHKSMNAMQQPSLYLQYGASNLINRVIVIAVVVSAHVAVLSVWTSPHNASAVKANQLSVSFTMTAQVPQSTPSQPRKINPAPAAVPLPVADQPAVVAEQEVAVAQPSAVAAPSMVPTTPVIADIEPDYKAAYLNNPPPAYPMVARRNGLQGRVMLKVEVLAGGLCGQINIHQSSGYAMLDNAALQTVKNWHFTPARHAGKTVDRWFIIPIQFSLKDNAA